MRGRMWSSLALAAAVAVGCSDSTGVTNTDLVGTWAASEFVFSDFADPVTDFDVIGMGGGATIVIRADSTFTTTITLPFSDPLVANGTWKLQGDKTLILTEGSETTALDVSLSGTTLTIHTTDLTFDFGNGEIPAQLNAKFTKQ